jgi:hypothetical protein
MTPIKTVDGSRSGGYDMAAPPSLRKGQIFLLLEERPSTAYSVLRRFLRPKDQEIPPEDSMVQNGKATYALVITRKFPPDLAKDQDLPQVPIYWLTTNLRQDIPTISPSAIPRLNLLVNEFILKNLNSLIVVDCLEYLITQNSFEVILRLIQAWNDKIVDTKARVLLSVDPLTLTIQQLHLIKKECLELSNS